jgi:hypothetical protein
MKKSIAENFRNHGKYTFKNIQKQKLGTACQDCLAAESIAALRLRVKCFV